jgi:hypothetical protein
VVPVRTLVEWLALAVECKEKEDSDHPEKSVDNWMMFEYQQEVLLGNWKQVVEEATRGHLKSMLDTRQLEVRLKWVDTNWLVEVDMPRLEEVGMQWSVEGDRQRQKKGKEEMPL